MANNRPRQNMTVTLDHELLKKLDERVASLSPPGGPARTRSWVVEQLLLTALDEAPKNPTAPNPEESLVDAQIRDLSITEGMPGVDSMKHLLVFTYRKFSRFPVTFTDWMAHKGLAGKTIAENIEMFVTLGWQAYFGTHEQPPWRLMDIAVDAESKSHLREPAYMAPAKSTKSKFITLRADPKFFQKP